MTDELKPMDLGKLLDRTFKMTFSNFRKNIKLFLIFTGIFFGTLVLFTLIGVVYYFFNKGLFENLSDPSGFLPLLPVLIPVILIFTIIMTVVSIFYNGMLFDVFIKSFLGKDWNIKDSFLFIRQKFFTIFVSGILCFFVLVGGILMCFIGVIPMSVFICLVLPAILFENKSITGSVSRSFKLVSYSFWSILGYSILLNIIISFGASILQYVFVGIFGLLSFLYKNDYGNMTFITLMIVFAVVFIIFYLVLCLIIYALNSAFYILIFFNQKIKFENFGIEMMTNSIIKSDDGDGEDGEGEKQ
jgi:hypothetical protein